MGALRSFLLRHRSLAALLLAASLCIKALLPAGYMPSGGERVLTVSVCADATGAQLTREIVLPAKGQPDHAGEQGKASCSFASLGMNATSGPHPILLALALAFAVALGFAPAAIPAPRAAERIRPPLRGPPTVA